MIPTQSILLGLAILLLLSVLASKASVDGDLFEKSQLRCIGTGYQPRARVLVV